MNCEICGALATTGVVDIQEIHPNCEAMEKSRMYRWFRPVSPTRWFCEEHAV